LSDDPRDLVEVEVENLAQQEHRALGWRELLEQYQESSGQRRGQLGWFLVGFGQRLGQPGTEVLHARPLRAPKPIDAQPGDDCGEVGTMRTDIGVLVL